MAVDQLNWLALALLGMVFASLANLTLKVVVKQASGAAGAALVKQELLNWVIPIAVALAIIFFLAWFFFLQNLVPANLLKWLVVLVFFSLASFACVVFALRTGKVALVTAVLSLSTILVAFLSYIFLGDRFEAKEVAAILFAVLSISLLVL